MRTSQALVASPLSTEFRRSFEAEVGQEPEYLTIPELRRLGPHVVLKRLLHGRGGVWYLPIEDETSEAILPLLQAVALLGLPRSIEVVRPDLSRLPIARRDAARGIAAVAGASVLGQVELLRQGRELRRLATAARLHTAIGPSRRVLYFNGNLWLGLKAGGSVGHMAGVVNALVDAGVHVSLAAVGTPPLIRADVHQIRLDPPRSFGIPAETSVYRFQRRCVDAVLRLREQYGLVYQRMSLGSYAGVALARRLGIPLVLEYNGSEVWVARNWGRPLHTEQIASLAEKVSLRHADIVVTVSEVLRDEVVARGVDPHRVVCYPNCVDPTRFAPDLHPSGDRLRVRASLGVGADATLVTFVGTFGQWHGAEVLARAAQWLREQDPAWLTSQDVRFLFVGDGLRLPDVRRIVDGDARCVFTGLVPQDDAPRLLLASDVLVSPHVRNADGSRFFGSPTKLFEYMASGRAIVASRLEQIAEVLSPGIDAAHLPREGPLTADGSCAVLAEPGDVAQLADAIRFLVDRPELRAYIGDNARARVLTRYTWADHVDAILAAVESRLGPLPALTLSGSRG